MIYTQDILGADIRSEEHNDKNEHIKRYISDRGLDTHDVISYLLTSLGVAGMNTQTTEDMVHMIDTYAHKKYDEDGIDQPPDDRKSRIVVGKEESDEEDDINYKQAADVDQQTSDNAVYKKIVCNKM